MFNFRLFFCCDINLKNIPIHFLWNFDVIDHKIVFFELFYLLQAISGLRVCMILMSTKMSTPTTILPLR